MHHEGACDKENKIHVGCIPQRFQKKVGECWGQKEKRGWFNVGNGVKFGILVKKLSQEKKLQKQDEKRKKEQTKQELKQQVSGTTPSLCSCS